MQKTHVLIERSSSFLRSLNAFSVALAAGLTLSPDTLTFFGNGLGAAGWLLLLILPVGILMHLTTVHSFSVLHADSGDHIAGFQRVLGRRCAAILLVCGKLPFVVCASAGLVVSAGFVFNEVFVYWFPNFAFAFLLLALILVLNFLGRKVTLISQALTVATACVGLFILTGSGILNPSAGNSLKKMAVDIDYRFLAAAVAVLVGFDMGLYVGLDNRKNFSQQSRALVIALVGSGVLLATWGLAAMAVVPPDKLESSTVPHMIMARKALGQTGRLIIGGVIIFGVFAAVNSMMYSVSNMINQLIFATKNSERSSFSAKIRVTTILFIAAASASMMAMGIAGEPLLETWIRSSLVLWLAYYMLVNLSAYLTRRDAPPMKKLWPVAFVNWLKVLSIVGTAATAAGIVLLEPEPSNMLMFTSAIAVIVAIAVNGVDFYAGRIARKIREN